MLIDIHTIKRVSSEQVSKLLAEYNLPEKISSEISSQIEAKVAMVINTELNDIRENVRITNQQIKVLREFVEVMSERLPK